MIKLESVGLLNMYTLSTVRQLGSCLMQRGSGLPQQGCLAAKRSDGLPVSGQIGLFSLDFM